MSTVKRANSMLSTGCLFGRLRAFSIASKVAPRTGGKGAMAQIEEAIEPSIIPFDKVREFEEEGMENNTLVKSSFSALINAPIDKVDIPSWCFTLPESEYQACSPAHFSAGATTAPDGRRMSINVEVIGGSLMVQHYIEEVSTPDHLKLVSNSDVFTPTGRTKIGVIWELSVKKIDDKTCEFTNLVHSSATPELMDLLGRQGIPLDVFRTARIPITEAHNRQETPMFAKSIERHALRTK